MGKKIPFEAVFYTAIIADYGGKVNGSEKIF